MAEVTSYVHGTPSWIDLATPDPAAARDFYGSLFGWEFSEEPTDQEGVNYIMVTKGGKTVAGMMELTSEMAESGMPPCWSSYVTVDDLERTVAKVEPAGGSVRQPPMDVMEAGRMAVIADPAGAVICLWQKKQHIGSELVNEHGTLTWNELITPDPGKAAEFYADVLGWTAQTEPMPNGNYTVFHTEGGNPNGIAGAMEPPMPGMPPFWGVYLAVDDCDKTMEEAKGSGAQVLAGPMDIEGVGRMATFMDPQGAAFSVMQPPS